MWYNEHMNISQLYVQAQKEIIPSSVLLSGEEEYPIFRYLELVKSTITFPDLNILELKDVFSYDDIENAFQSTPMMDDFRLIILHKTGYFKWNKDKRFYDLFQQVPSHIRLIVFEQDLNKVSANYKRFAKTTTIVLSPNFKKDYYEKWLRGKFKAQGVVPSKEFISSLATTSAEKGMFEAKNAVDYFLSLDWELHQEDIDNYFNTTSEESIWSLYESLSGNRMTMEVEALLRQGTDAMELFARISSSFRDAKKLKIGTLKTSPFMTKVASAVASKFSNQALDEVLQTLAQADIELKSVFAKKEDILVQLTMRISKIKHRN